EDGIRDRNVTGVQTCALPISARPASAESSHRSKRQMKADSCIELRHEPARHGSDASTDPLDRDRSNLLDLRLGIPVESCNRGPGGCSHASSPSEAACAHTASSPESSHS